MTTTVTTAMAEVSAARLQARLDALAAIGPQPDGSILRLPYSPEDREAQRVLAGWMAELELEIRTDPAGNVFGRWPGEEPDAPVVLTGSHLDTQPGGGRFDGVAGVLAGLEAIAALKAAGHRPRHGIELVSYAGEEGGGCFEVGVIGSRAMVGALTEEHLRRRCRFRKISLAEAMEGCGLDVGRLAEAELADGSVRAVVELHIEQGPTLEEQGRTIGVVTAIAGNRRVPLVIRGQQAHSGGMPMRARRDALVGAAEIVVAAEAVAREHTEPPVVATTGFFHHAPREVAMVPGRATMTVEVRSVDDGALHGAADEILRRATEITQRRGLGLKVGEAWGTAPATTDPDVVALLAAAAVDDGHEPLLMASGASHDAMVLSARFPAGMLFVPSVGGISHAPEELTETADLVAGTRVLTRALARLADGEGWGGR